jgi:hypothetical protein
VILYGAYVKIYKVQPNSFQALVGYGKDSKGVLQLLMLTSSKKTLKNPKEGEEYICDIRLKKDSQYNIWLIVDKVVSNIKG